MSRIGNKLIQVPVNVSVALNNREIEVKGPLGTQKMVLESGVDIKIDGNQISLTRVGENISHVRALHGLSRALLSNMILGVSKGFEKDLEILGVGYRATQQNKNVVFQLGYSHNITFSPPPDITVEVLEPTKLKVKGIDKQKVGQVAANIRELRSPEPYKGKGIRYKNEHVRKKAGKAGKK
ncbi:MAG: 50S ribosomal protein L6 [Spirochaetes bacterium]|nr:MAG: 50S ribosomal protein L6 [Spirochaetota bacterium]